MANNRVIDRYGQSRPKRVLAVDDSGGIREFLLDALTALGYDARVCDGFDNATKMLAGWTPEIALIDLMMAPRDGTSLVVWIRQRFGKDIRLVLYSARQDAELVSAVASDVKPDAFLAKPFDLEDLDRVLGTETT